MHQISEQNVSQTKHVLDFQAKDKNVKCIKDTYKDSPHMKLAVLNSVKSNLNHIANKTLVDNR